MVPWYKQKTTLTCISGVLLAWGAYLSPDPTTHISLISAAFATVTALAGVFMRQAVEKSGPAVVPMAPQTPVDVAATGLVTDPLNASKP